MTHWRAFIVALALPLLFTAIVLVVVARNRVGPRDPITLSEREVTLSAQSDDNSGMTAWISWSGDEPAGEEWIPADTLRALGFDVTPGAADVARPRRAQQLLRRAYVALELRDAQPSRSRLVPIDASPDVGQLLAKYPNGRTHLVTAAFIGLRAVPVGGAMSWRGYLASIDPRGIHVPAQFAATLRRQAGERRFTLAVRYGSQLEPWIEDAR